MPNPAGAAATFKASPGPALGTPATSATALAASLGSIARRRQSVAATQQLQSSSPHPGGTTGRASLQRLLEDAGSPIRPAGSSDFDSAPASPLGVGSRGRPDASVASLGSVERASRGRRGSVMPGLLEGRRTQPLQSSITSFGTAARSDGTATPPVPAAAPAPAPAVPVARPNVPKGRLLGGVERQLAIAVLKETIERIMFLREYEVDVATEQLDFERKLVEDISHYLYGQDDLEARYSELIEDRRVFVSKFKAQPFMFDPKTVQSTLNANARQRVQLRNELKDKCQVLTKNLDNPPDFGRYIDKVRLHRNRLLKLVLMSLKEASATGTFAGLENRVGKDKRELGALIHELAQREQRAAESVESARRELDKVKLAEEDTIRGLDLEIADLQAQLVHQRKVTATISSYVTDEQEATKEAIERQEGQELKERSALKEDMIKRVMHELRNHQHMKAFLVKRREQAMNQALDWADRYDADMLVKEEELRDLQSRLRAVREEFATVRSSLLNKQSQHQQMKVRVFRQRLMRSWNTAAVIIQRYWRGRFARTVLVKRRRLQKQQEEAALAALSTKMRLRGQAHDATMADVQDGEDGSGAGASAGAAGGGSKGPKKGSASKGAPKPAPGKKKDKESKPTKKLMAKPIAALANKSVASVLLQTSINVTNNLSATEVLSELVSKRAQSQVGALPEMMHSISDFEIEQTDLPIDSELLMARSFRSESRRGLPTISMAATGHLGSTGSLAGFPDIGSARSVSRGGSRSPSPSPVRALRMGSSQHSARRRVFSSSRSATASPKMLGVAQRGELM